MKNLSMPCWKSVTRRIVRELWLAEERVMAGAAEQLVVALAADQLVVSGIALQDVVTGAADQVIVVSIAAGRFDAERWTWRRP